MDFAEEEGWWRAAKGKGGKGDPEWWGGGEKGDGEWWAMTKGKGKMPSGAFMGDKGHGDGSEKMVHFLHRNVVPRSLGAGAWVAAHGRQTRLA